MKGLLKADTIDKMFFKRFGDRIAPPCTKVRANRTKSVETD